MFIYLFKDDNGLFVCLFVYSGISKDNIARTIEPDPAANLPQRFCILFISAHMFPLYMYNSRIVRYNSRIGGQSRNSYFAQVQFRNCTDSYFAQNIYIRSHLDLLVSTTLLKDAQLILFSLAACCQIYRVTEEA